MKDKAKALAQKWVSANFKLYKNSKNCGRKMWEKIRADTAAPGRGGEYSVQTNFGWTIGVLLDLLITYSDELTLSSDPSVSCEDKIMLEEPIEFPNNASEKRSRILTAAQKQIDKLNQPWAASRPQTGASRPFLKFCCPLTGASRPFLNLLSSAGAS
ncbi:hypothetical protein niasHS_008027 [Heterodera schachtii]|uniref:Trehalase n=1 Tax=Heterodera schachtii TaxID=97005 RepID=A0ABD2J757_HETSC